MVRKKPDTYIDITVDMDELDLTSSEAKATYDEIKDYIFDKYHVMPLLTGHLCLAKTDTVLNQSWIILE